MEGSSVPYVVESGDVAGAAAPVVEGAVKPAATVRHLPRRQSEGRDDRALREGQKQTLGDVAQLGVTLRSRLMYGVLRKVEQQVIAGDGVGANLTGILATPGLATPDVSAIDLAADKSMKGLVTVLVSGAVPTVIALHPRDWSRMLTAKSTGSGEYLSAGPFAATAQQLWGTRAVPALGIPEGTALIGDSRLGCTLLVREGVAVLVSDSDGDYFTRNMVTLLAEGRWALAIWQPSAWAMVDLT